MVTYDELPDDCWECILLKAPIQDLMSLSRTGHYFYSMLNEDHLWEMLLIRDFGYLEDASSEESAKQTYIMRFTKFQFNTIVEQPKKGNKVQVGVDFDDDSGTAACNNGQWNTVFGQHIWKENTGVHSFTAVFGAANSSQQGILQVPPFFQLEGTKLVSIGPFRPNESIHHHGQFQYTDELAVPEHNFLSVFTLGGDRIFMSPHHDPVHAGIVIPSLELSHTDHYSRSSSVSTMVLNTNTREFQYWIGREKKGKLIYSGELPFPGPWVPAVSMTGSITTYTNLESNNSLWKLRPDIMERVEEFERESKTKNK